MKGSQDDEVCTENALIERIQILSGAGMSIGSIPPRKKTFCVYPSVSLHLLMSQRIQTAVCATSRSGTSTPSILWRWYMWRRDKSQTSQLLWRALSRMSYMTIFRLSLTCSSPLSTSAHNNRYSWYCSFYIEHNSSLSFFFWKRVNQTEQVKDGSTSQPSPESPYATYQFQM